MYYLYFFFFFSSRRRHTRYWRDWSSDVCSSDLSRVERRATRCRRERENRVARLLLRRQCSRLQRRHGGCDVGAVLEHRRVRRDREEILREPVVDVAGDPCPLLSDCAPELGGADRPPDSD